MPSAEQVYPEFILELQAETPRKCPKVLDNALKTLETASNRLSQGFWSQVEGWTEPAPVYMRKTKMQIEVPRGVLPGQQLKARLPDGREVAATGQIVEIMGKCLDSALK